MSENNGDKAMSEPNTVKKSRGRPTNEAKRAERPKRVPMSGQRLRMSIGEEDKDPAFHYAWINDQKDLIFRAKRAGYEHVLMSEIPSWGTPDVDSAGGTASVISMPVGGKVNAFLMKQPMEYYEEDQQAKAQINQDRIADLMKELNSGKEGTYGDVDVS